MSRLDPDPGAARGLWGGRPVSAPGKRRLRLPPGPRESEESRRRWRFAAAAVAAMGLAAGIVGLFAPRYGADTSPRPVAAGATVAVPTRGTFGGTVALYAQASADRPPSAAALGCTVSGGSLTVQGVASQDRLVIDGVAIIPVLVLVAVPEPAVLRCSGPDASLVTPMYLVATPGVERMVPMAAFSLATLLCVLGGAGLVVLRSDAG